MPMPDTRDESIQSTPRVTVFQAGLGDSCLLEWRDIRILIDGGGTQPTIKSAMFIAPASAVRAWRHAGAKAVQNSIAAEKIFRGGGLSSINQLGLVLVIECITHPQQRVWRLLFTGDACGKDIANALESGTDADGVKWNMHLFDYVDMPHHGSGHNEPAEFLTKLATKRLVVSTNGKTYGHPDPETCTALKSWMEIEGNETNLFFNYKNHARKDGVSPI
eukprot:gene7919-9438_t